MSDEIEDDPGEMVEHIAVDVLQDGGTDDITKSQFRDALVNLIDERIALAESRRPKLAVETRGWSR